MFDVFSGFPVQSDVWKVFVAVDRSSCRNGTVVLRDSVALASRNLIQFDSNSTKIFAAIKAPKQNVNKAIFF